MKSGIGYYNAWYYIYLCVLVLLAPTTGLSIILHPGIGEPNLTTWTDRPVNAIVGRWSSNASFVVVSPKWILTTRHQNTSPATVNVNGVTYNCIYNYQWTGGGSTNNADIRLIRLKNLDGSDPNLAYYADLYTAIDEMQHRDIVIGGYGKYRGDTLYFGQEDYGYSWAGSSNDTLRWGQNIIDGTVTAQNADSYDSNTVYAYFDKHGTTYEAAPAEWDSGGGWFINQGGNWKLAALSAYVKRADETWYDDPNTPSVTDPDWFLGIRISSYADWINEIIDADCPVGDLNSDCKVNMLDFAEFANWWLHKDCVNGNSFCNGADFQSDGDVDIIDLAFFAQNWLLDKSP
jgi:hypothetical protein